MFAKCAGGSVVTRLLATWFVVFSMMSVGVIVVVTGASRCVVVCGIIVMGMVTGDCRTTACVVEGLTVDVLLANTVVFVGAGVVASVVGLVLGISESTTPMGPSKSISESAHVNSSGWIE